jgi:hypothetical protein
MITIWSRTDQLLVDVADPSTAALRIVAADGTRLLLPQRMAKQAARWV